MRILSPPRRTSISGATFSRNSEAIDSLGRIALPGLPRLEYVAGVGWVTWVEEADVNLLTPNQASAETDATGFAQVNSATLSQDIDEYKYGNASLKVVTSGSTSAEGFAINPVATVSASNVYTASVWLKGSGTVKLGIQERDSSSASIGYTYSSLITLSDVWVRHNVTRIFGLTGVYARLLVDTDSIQAITFYADGLQLEQKAYPTNFCLPGSPRAAESLTMPTAGLSVAEGTIEGIVEITDVTKRQISGQVQYICNIPGGVLSYGITLTHAYDSANWRLITFNDSGTASSVLISDSLTLNGFYYYKIPWEISEAKIEFWSLSTGTKVATGTLSTPNLPSAFGANGRLGSYNGSQYFANTRFGKHRLSNIARTADPDFDNLMPNDANTVGIFDPTPVYNHLT